MSDLFARLLILSLLIVATSVATTLLTVAALLSRRDDRFRLAVAAIPFFLLALAEAFEPLAFLIVQSLVVFLFVLTHRHLLHENDPSHPFARPFRWPRNFKLSSILIAQIPLAFMFVALALSPPRSPWFWWNLTFVAALAASAGYFAVWATVNARRRTTAFVTLFCVVVLLSLVPANYDNFLPGFPDLSFDRHTFEGAFGRTESRAAAARLAWFLILPSIFLLTATIFARSRWGSKYLPTADPVASASSSAGNRLVLIALLSLLLVPISVTLAALLIRKPFPYPHRPTPNAYANLLKSHDLLRSEWDLWEWRHLPSDDLRRVVNENAPARESLRLALAQPSAKLDHPTTTNPADLPQRLRGDADQVVFLTCLLAAEGRLAALERRDDDAADSFLACVRLGHLMALGSLKQQWLAAMHTQRLGLNGLTMLRHRLSPDASNRVVAELRRLDLWRESPADVHLRDRLTRETALGWSARLDRNISNANDRLFGRTLVAESDHGFERLCHTLCHLLALEIAVHQYHRLHGDFPDRLDRCIAPDDPLMIDPYGDGEHARLAYRRTADGYFVTTIGVGRGDDAGTASFNHWSEPGDRTLDAYFDYLQQQGTVYSFDLTPSQP